MTDQLLNPQTRNPGDEFPNRWLYIASGVIGGVYGLTLRILAGLQVDALRVMSIGFIFFMPFALGCIAVYIAEIKRRQRVWTWIWLPWLSLLAALGGTLVTLLEGIICIAMFLPIGLLLASIGGVVGGLAARYVRSRRLQSLTMACILVLPFLTGPWERRVSYEWETRHVENVVDIQAPPAVVWQNIERVSAIRREELPSSWAHAIGFPDPIEATLSHEGVGAACATPLLPATSHSSKLSMSGNPAGASASPSPPTGFRPPRSTSTSVSAVRTLTSSAESTAWSRCPAV